jgi:hypothetical protein
MTTGQQVSDKVVILDVLRSCGALEVGRLALAISPNFKRVGRKGWIGGSSAFVVVDEVAEADYTSLGHSSGVWKTRDEGCGRRDS